jgi:hypothetical protein
MPTILRDNPIFTNLRRNIQDVGNVVLSQKLEEQKRMLADEQRKKELQDKIKEAVVTVQLKNMRLKEGGNLGTAVSDEGGVDLSQFERYDPLASILGGGKPQTTGSPALGGEGQGGFKLKGITTDAEGNLKYNIEPNPTEEERKILSKEKLEQSPFFQQAKAKRTEDLFSTLENNKVKREMISEAEKSTTKIPTGLGGKMKMWWNKMFDPENPTMGEWQKVKMVLTDAQLLNTAKTKGAISDSEMELFAKAAANDNISSVRAMKPVFDKLTKFIDSEERAKLKSYETIYNEDTGIFTGKAMGQGAAVFNGQARGQGQQTPQFMSEAEAEAANLPQGTIVIINGRPARID